MSLTNAQLVAAMKEANLTSHLEKLKAADIDALKVDKLNSTADLDRFLDQARATARRHPGCIKQGIDEVIWSWKATHEVKVLADTNLGVPRDWADFLKLTKDQRHFKTLIRYSSSVEAVRECEFAAELFKPLVNVADIKAIATSTETETKKREMLKEALAHLWEVKGQKDSISAAAKLRASVEGIRETFSMFIGDSWLRDMILKGGRFKNFASLRSFIIRTIGLDEKLESHPRVSDMCNDVQKIMFDKKATYAAKYHRLLQLSSKFAVRPLTQDSHALFNGAYDNDVKPEVGDVTEKPPAQGLQDIKNEDEELGPALKVLCMSMAMVHVPTPDLVEIENTFAKDHGSLHPLALAQWRYEFQDAIALREKAGKRILNPAGACDTVTVRKVGQMTPTQQAEQLEKLHVAAMREFGKGFQHDSAPTWTNQFKKTRDMKREALESLKGSDICNYCAHFRKELGLHLAGPDYCPHWNSETEAPNPIKRHQNRRKWGKPKEAQVSKVTPKEDDDIDSIDLQY